MRAHVAIPDRVTEAERARATRAAQTAFERTSSLCAAYARPRSINREKGRSAEQRQRGQCDSRPPPPEFPADLVGPDCKKKDAAREQAVADDEILAAAEPDRCSQDEADANDDPQNDPAKRPRHGSNGSSLESAILRTLAGPVLRTDP